MYCTNPNYFSKYGFTECRKCHACKVNQKKELADRLIIERRYHKFAYFVTLTYSPENYPKDECLHKEHLINYFKRLCKLVPDKIVNFGVGEYGDETGRAHYHCCIFGDVNLFRPIIDAWSLDGVPIGRVSVDQLSNGRCKYAAGYCVKKMLKDDDDRLDGRTPEFRIIPRRPALGYGLIYELATACAKSPRFRQQFTNRTFVPHAIHLNGTWIRLPRYVREHLKGFFDDPKHKQAQRKYVLEKAELESALSRSITSEFSLLRGIDKRFKAWKQKHQAEIDRANELNELAYNKRKRRPL